MPGKVRRREELGAFLRSRRERLKPDMLGFRSLGRRRTPGLRREEMCERAGLGLSWYIWLEQGRDVGLSPQVLMNICRALELNSDETNYAFDLAEIKPIKERQDIVTSASKRLQHMLDCMEFVPAYIINSRWDRIAWNEAALAVLGDFTSDAPRERNSIWKTFTNPNSKRTVQNWNVVAQLMLAEFNASRSRFIQEPWMEDFIEQLMSASSEFREWWPKREVLYSRDKQVFIKHDRVGELIFDHSSFHLASDEDLTLVIFTPTFASDTPRKLRLLLSDLRKKKNLAVPQSAKQKKK